MKIITTIGVVTAFALASLIVVYICGVVGISAIYFLLYLFDFAWGTTLHTEFNQALIMVDNILSYWMRFLWILYIPAIIIIRIKYIEKIIKKWF